MTTSDLVRLRQVTMMEAVHQLRGRGFYVHFEREALTEHTVDRSRPVLDARRRFDADLQLDAGAEQVVTQLVAADAGYDWVRVTRSPDSFFVFPRSTERDRMAGSILREEAASMAAPAGRPVADALVALGVGPGLAIEVFDRAGFLKRAIATTVGAVAGRPLYDVIGEIFARSGDALVWDVTTGVGGGGPLMAVSRLASAPR